MEHRDTLFYFDCIKFERDLTLQIHIFTACQKMTYIYEVETANQFRHTILLS